MDANNTIYPALPRWVAGLYGVLAIVTVPWTIYLALTLPARHLSKHWDVAWVGLDIAIIIALGLNAVFSHNGSKWLVMSATATSTLLVVDTWLDLITSRGGKPFVQALLLGLVIELPLALITFLVARRMVMRRFQ